VAAPVWMYFKFLPEVSSPVRSMYFRYEIQPPGWPYIQPRTLDLYPMNMTDQQVWRDLDGGLRTWISLRH